MDFLYDIFKYKNHSYVCGLTDELCILYYYNYFKKNKDNVLIVTNSLYDANRIFRNLKTYTEDVCLFPMDDFLPSVALAMSPDLRISRLETLEHIKNYDKSIIVTNLMGYLRFLPAYEQAKKLKVELKVNTKINRDKFIKCLDEFGYTRTSLVTATGEYAVRGFIVDIFPINEEHPIRIELFGSDIEAIRIFDEETQLSINDIDVYTLLPIKEINVGKYNSLLDYLKMPMVFLVNEKQILNGYHKLRDEIEEYSKGENNEPYMYSLEEVKASKYIKVETINNIQGSLEYKSKSILKFNGNYDKLCDYCRDWIKSKTVVICLSKEQQIMKISKLFDDVNVGSVKEKTINIINVKINEGFIIDDYVFISEYDIDDLRVTNVYKNNLKMGRKIKSFDDLKLGDYVVHSQHGIGVYGGVVPLKSRGMVRDYILINYLETDKVYVPVEKIDTIYKYSDVDGARPKLNKLNSVAWAKTKMRVRKKIKDISDELIKLYATRSKAVGPSFADYPEEVIFANNFEYQETSDQTKTIGEILEDLRKKTPMDRLLCGDVGFGKTEVAFRAMFKTVINGYQVAYLCPTTLLSRQQYNNALSRFKDFPISIALLNRFTPFKEVKRIYEGLENGTIDIVFGTHKLLNNKIKYNNLGLLVVDEEQRFGVTHKEKIKSFKDDVNVLTLSATPIPRTLKMAMSGLRDLSIIDTPPINRYPVQTYVLEENDLFIKDAIYKELARNGQVFVLYNQVASIEQEIGKIATLVPEARIVMAHGQMEKNELERVVSDYIDGKYDVLVCTTIIETGIDIPNVNTLIVIDADNFGLAQLYQLRGRVGRSNKIAYAYLMYKPAKILTDTAVKRLKSIKDFTELGSGYKIAMRDLSIRGAGDLLGSEQAGFVDSVGLELYTKMINEEIRRINGEEVDEETESQPLIEVENHISDEYVSEESIKIEIHQLINTIQDENTLINVKKEIEDRFGNISKEMEIYMYEEWFEKLARKLNIKNVKQTENMINIELPEETTNKVVGDKLFLIAYNINIKFRLEYKMKMIYIKLPIDKKGKHFIYDVVKLLCEIVNMVEK